METCVLDAFTTIPLKHTPRGVSGTEPCLGELRVLPPAPHSPSGGGLARAQGHGHHSGRQPGQRRARFQKTAPGEHRSLSKPWAAAQEQKGGPHLQGAARRFEVTKF